VLLLQINTMELADELVRVDGDLAGELDSSRARLADLKREQDSLIAIVLE
jgi:hypothetical protein